NGARTRFADLYHGLFLLLFVALVPWLIHQIPLAALGAMLVYTGFRLASPREFASVYKVGPEQWPVFTTTLVARAPTHLRFGIGIGIGVEFLIHLINYAPVRSLFLSDLSVEQCDEKTYRVRVRHVAVFSNWISMKGRLSRLDDNRDVILDLSDAHL